MWFALSNWIRTTVNYTLSIKFCFLYSAQKETFQFCFLPGAPEQWKWLLPISKYCLVNPAQTLGRGEQGRTAPQWDTVLPPHVLQLSTQTVRVHQCLLRKGDGLNTVPLAEMWKNCLGSARVLVNRQTNG